MLNNLQARIIPIWEWVSSATLQLFNEHMHSTPTLTCQLHRTMLSHALGYGQECHCIENSLVQSQRAGTCALYLAHQNHNPASKDHLCLHLLLTSNLLPHRFPLPSTQLQPYCSSMGGASTSALISPQINTARNVTRTTYCLRSVPHMANKGSDSAHNSAMLIKLSRRELSYLQSPANFNFHRVHPATTQWYCWDRVRVCAAQSFSTPSSILQSRKSSLNRAPTAWSLRFWLPRWTLKSGSHFCIRLSKIHVSLQCFSEYQNNMRGQIVPSTPTATTACND